MVTDKNLVELILKGHQSLLLLGFLQPVLLLGHRFPVLRRSNARIFSGPIPTWWCWQALWILGVPFLFEIEALTIFSGGVGQIQPHVIGEIVRPPALHTLKVVLVVCLEAMLLIKARK